MKKSSFKFFWEDSLLEMLPSRALFLPETKELLICDIHLGKAEYFQQNGIPLTNNSDKNNHLCLNCIFPNKDDVDLPRCDVVGISGISAGLAGLIAAQKIINFYLNLKDETNIMTISDGKKLSIDNIVIKSKHDCYLKSV